jgi:membrane-bound lytic murein transglycosylase B
MRALVVLGLGRPKHYQGLIVYIVGRRRSASPSTPLMGASPQSRRRIEQTRPLVRCATALAVVALAPAAAAAPPPPDLALPREPAALAQALTATTSELRTAIGRWTDKASAPSRELTLYALHQQRIYRLLARDHRLADRTLARLPPDLAAVSRDFLLAHAGLYRLTPPIGVSRIKVGPARGAGVLLGYYRESQRRFGAQWNVLAAVNFVESKFGRLRSASAAGAQGPMQFMPATWRQYGLGGNVHDARDAILGAANYLRASGAPRNLRRALYAYNHSSAYVDAVLRYARRIGADRTTFFALYNWQVFVKTPSGDRRVTGPGLP